MNGLPDPDGEAGRWLTYAEEDLATAQLIMDADGPLRQVCTPAQQAAEKALKAALVAEGEDPPRSHNLARILRMLPDRWTVKQIDPHLAGLSEWAVAARYPGDWEEPTSLEAADALAVAGSVVRSIRDDLRDR